MASKSSNYLEAYVFTMFFLKLSMRARVRYYQRHVCLNVIIIVSNI